MGGLQDSTGFQNEVVRPSTFLGDMSRSPTAFKMASLNSPPNTQKSFDSLGLASGAHGGALPSLGSSQNGFSRSSPPSDRAARTIYVSNVCLFHTAFQSDLLTCNRCSFDLVRSQWPPHYGPAEFDQFFRTAGHIVRSDLGSALGIENRGYGTIVYSSEDEAKVAVARFNGYVSLYIRGV
jgi:hypothetical protein